MSFAVNMARREWRSTLRRLGVYMMSITVGVGALVALHSSRNDVVRSINEESRSLLGADARISANRELPDSVTARGSAHLAELAALARAGHRAVMFYLVNRPDCETAGPAADIDPAYAENLRAARADGVEVLAYRSRVRRSGVRVEARIPFEGEPTS